MNTIKDLLYTEYNIDTDDIKRISTGVGGDTVLIISKQGKFIFKSMDVNQMNKPEQEPDLCNYLLKNNIAVSEFIANKSGKYFSIDEKGNVYHVQKYVEGKNFSMNCAPEWFMNEAPVLLGKIHNVLENYNNLPDGIGKDFFYYMTPKNACESYKNSLKTAIEKKQEDIIEDLEFRIKCTEKFNDMEFDISKLTYKNTHGDYTINQIMCGHDKVNAVIDWTCACRHPVIWEITRSFYYAEPTCAEGKIDYNKFCDYIKRYCSVTKLTQYDKDNILKLYYYQLAVCDYYSQYFNADDYKKEEFLLQAKFATRVLKYGNL